jgi:hypothetical protein
MNEELFRVFIKEDLHLEDEDLLRLMRVLKLDKLGEDQGITVPIIVQNFETRYEASKKVIKTTF